MPLITKSDGSKFGKTESGTIWLDPARTSPYSFYQFWLSVADDDAYRFLRYFTFLSVADIADIERADAQRSGRPEGQRILAEEVTRLVHGDEGLAAAQRITDSMFSGESAALSQPDLEQLMLDGLPSSTLDTAALPETLTQLLADVGMAASGKQIKDALQREAVIVNGRALGMSDNASPAVVFGADTALYGRFHLVRLGKKKYHLFARA